MLMDAKHALEISQGLLDNREDRIVYDFLENVEQDIFWAASVHMLGVKYFALSKDVPFLKKIVDKLTELGYTVHCQEKGLFNKHIEMFIYWGGGNIT